MKKDKDLFLEEAILDDLSQNFSAMELPLSKRVFNFLILFTCLIGAIVIFRVCFLNFGTGDFYKNRALANISDVTVLPAERGLIYDRYGNILVENRPTFSVVLKASDFLKKDKNIQEEETIILEEVLALPKGQIINWLSAINLERQNLIVLARNLSVEQVAKIKTLKYSGISIESSFERSYMDSKAFSHILGYVGMVSEKDLAENKNLLLNDLIGKAGLELFYDNELRGENGEKIDFRNAKNEGVGQDYIVEAVKGADLILTVDKEFQEYFYDRLKNQLESLGRVSGVGLAMNPQTGEILSLFSLPSYNSEKITKEDLTSGHRPLFNRAVSGVYNPGSSIKPLVAVAALQENIVSPVKQIYSQGFIEIPNPYFPEQPSRFLDWKPHGWVDLYSALARSSNVYFYAVGGGFGDVKGLGIERLKKYWEKFGLNKKTGIDLPNEKEGFLPDVEEKEKRSGTPWRLGDTYNVSIGQGDLMMTPLELLNYVSAIANQGRLYKLFCAEKIINANGEIIYENKPSLLSDISEMALAIEEVQKGMVDGTQKSYGTSYMLNDLPFVVAAKTGSAQIEWNTKTNAFFVGYGPVYNDNNELSEDNISKQIAILVLIEDAKEGGLNAVPVARDVFKWYYSNRIMNKE